MGMDMVMAMNVKLLAERNEPPYQFDRSDVVFGLGKTFCKR